MSRRARLAYPKRNVGGSGEGRRGGGAGVAYAGAKGMRGVEGTLLL